jgi:hypothetical protein
MMQSDEQDDTADKSGMELTDADWEYIKVSDDQIARGEWVVFDSSAAEMRRKYGAQPE